MDAQILLHISKLFERRSSFVINGLKVTPYLEAVNLSFIFTWGDGETEDRAKVFTSPLFEGSSINSNELQDNSIKNKMHDNKMTELRVKRYMWHVIISILSPLRK